MPNAEADLIKLAESLPELDRLLDRLADLVPIWRRQRAEHDQAAAERYYSSDVPSEEAKALWRRHRVISGSDLVRIGYGRLDTPEARELRAIGLAVAAFGGSEAISLIGWTLADRLVPGGQSVWSAWDGMAGHWL